MQPSLGGGRGDSIETLYVDIAARADQLTKEAEAAVNEVINHLNRVDKQNKQLEGSFGSLGKHIKQALTIATGITFANWGAQLIQRVVGLGKALISTNAQMQMFERSFETMTGSAEEAGEIIEWVKEQAKATPFDVPGLIAASQSLMTWGLDLKEWFTIVGDVAAAMNRPLRQVVNAVGTLASGQTGEAVRRFRDLGINLREYTDQLSFDARGALVTPLEEAIPIVRQIMEDKFGGMMESQSKTWSGVMSNMQDTWQQFVQVMGEPVFDLLNEALFDLYTWIEANGDAIENLGRNIGEALGSAMQMLFDLVGLFDALVATYDQLMTSIAGTPDWLQNALTTGKQLTAMGGAYFRGMGDFLGGVAGGEGLEEAVEGSMVAAHDTLMAIAGEEADAVEDLTEKFANLTDVQLAGVEAVRVLGEGYREWDDVAVMVTVSQGHAIEQMKKVVRLVALQIEGFGILGDAGTDLAAHLREMVAALDEETQATQEVTAAFDAGVVQYEATRAKIAEMIAEYEQLKVAQQANLELALEVGTKLTEKLQNAMEAYQKSIQQAVKETSEAITAIQQNASAAETAATEQYNQQVQTLQRDHAREQLRRRRQFNQEWARLIREQHEANIDADWEYHYQRGRLLIEGDEMALADLEARYKHEKDVRGREQGEEREDFQQRWAEQEQAREEQFQLQLEQQRQRLEQELENIRLQAQEDIDEKKRALEEKTAAESAALEAKLAEIGEALGKEIKDNEEATNTILQAWSDMYGAQVAEAVRAGVVVRQEMDSIINRAIRAAALVARVPGGGGYVRPGGGANVAYQAGGYTPPYETDVRVHPSEFIANAATTQALEAAAGGQLTQTRLVQLARSRLDVHLHGHGVDARVQADHFGPLREELIRMFEGTKDEW